MVGKKIQITYCNAFGPQFENLTPGSIHTIIEPVSNYLPNGKSVWVMGTEGPVRLLEDEFNLLK